MKKYWHLMVYEVKGAWTIFRFLWANRLELADNTLILSMYLVNKKKLEALITMMENAEEEQDEASVQS